MRIRLALASLVVLSLFPSTAVASQAPASCKTTYTRAMFHTGARSYFHQPTQAKRKVLKRIVRCQRGGKRSRRIVRFHLARYRRAAAQRAAVRSLTPYDCGRAGRFALPCRIIACESGFSWSAYNPSGAAGPYQIMAMHGRPFPVRSAADRLRHHQIAANLYRGGAGASHWVCK